jgi:16S rRNA (guanine527-N7)-methyltransferase
MILLRLRLVLLILSVAFIAVALPIVQVTTGGETLLEWKQSGIFPFITDHQWVQLEKFRSELIEWNTKVNVVSRKDIDMLVPSHIIPSLAVSKIRMFVNERVIDIGTGGGFPGLPLAIVCPNAQFTLMDSNGKKALVVQSIAQTLGLPNVRVVNARAEALTEKFDFMLGRAVTKIPNFLSFSSHLLDENSKSRQSQSANEIQNVSNGLLYIKGGEYEEELREADLTSCQSFPIKNILGGFETDKNVLYVPGNEVVKFYKRKLMVDAAQAKLPRKSSNK